MIDAPTTMPEAEPIPGVLAFQPDAVLTIEQVAQWFQVSTKTIDRMDLPFIYVGRLRRYIARDVLDAARKRRRD